MEWLPRLLSAMGLVHAVQACSCSAGGEVPRCLRRLPSLCDKSLILQIVPEHTNGAPSVDRRRANVGLSPRHPSWTAQQRPGGARGGAVDARLHLAPHPTCPAFQESRGSEAFLCPSRATNILSSGMGCTSSQAFGAQGGHWASRAPWWWEMRLGAVSAQRARRRGSGWEERRGL